MPQRWMLRGCSCTRLGAAVETDGHSPAPHWSWLLRSHRCCWLWGNGRRSSLLGAAVGGLRSRRQPLCPAGWPRAQTVVVPGRQGEALPGQPAAHAGGQADQALLIPLLLLHVVQQPLHRTPAQRAGVTASSPPSDAPEAEAVHARAHLDWPLHLSLADAALRVCCCLCWLWLGRLAHGTMSCGRPSLHMPEFLQNLFSWCLSALWLGQARELLYKQGGL